MNENPKVRRADAEKKDTGKTKITRRIRVKKFRPDQDPAKDKPIETVELPEEVTENARK